MLTISATSRMWTNIPTRSIGVSNFEIADLEKLKGANVLPAVNQVRRQQAVRSLTDCRCCRQILLHPYVWQRQKALVDYCQSKGIKVEAYSPLMCAPFRCFPYLATDRMNIHSAR